MSRREMSKQRTVEGPYKERLEALAPLENFDPAAFLDDDVTTQNLCSFVLALAVAYNDFADIILAYRALASVKPSDEQERTPQRGQYSGLQTALNRLLAGAVSEVLVLIEKNRRTVDGDDFQSLLNRLSPRSRESWQDLYDVARKRNVKSTLGKALVDTRNHVAFHYGARHLADGFESAFSSGRCGLPCVSRGVSMMGTRFYFADAAAQAAFFSEEDTAMIESALNERSRLLADLNQALYDLVTTFVAWRGYTWRTEP